MAEIVDTLRLEIDQALGQINQIERALDRAIAPIEVEVDVAQAEQLESTLREIERIAERASTETAAMALAAGRAETNFEDLARALNITEDEARRLTQELVQSQAAANRLEDAARDVARQLGLSDREAERLSRSLREADRAAEAIDVSTISLGARFAALRSSAVLIGGALAGLGGTAILAGALTGANAAIQSFARLEDSINAVKVVFEEASAGVLTFGESAAQSAGLSQEAFNQAVAPIGGLLQNFGFDAREAADAAVILVQRGADLASVYGGSVQDALLAVGAALRGEADPLERYSASISAARVETFALANGLAKTKAEITPAITLQARYGLILEDTAKVAGDYAANVGDLANAQKTAAGELQNFVAGLGEDLAPALETILTLLPEVVEGFRQLTPELVAGADSAAEFFQSVGEGGGFRTEFAAIAVGLDIVTSNAGLAKEAFSVLSEGLQGDFEGMAEAAGRGGALIEQNFINAIGFELARALDKGEDSMSAFAIAIARTARASSDFGNFTGAFRDFAIAANLTDLELRDVTQELITNADAIGLTAEEVQFLTTQLALLNSFLFTDIEAVRQFNFETRALADVLTPLSTETTRFTTFLGEIPPAMVTTASQMRDAAREMGEALNPFEEATEQIDVSAEEFFERLIEEINEQAIFQSGIAELIMRKQFALAEFLGEQGPEVQDALTGFLEDVDLAAAANAGLAGEGTALSREIGNQIATALSSGELTPEMEAAFLDFLDKGIFSNTQVENGILVGSGGMAEETASAYFDELGNEIDNFDSAVLQEKLGNLFAGVTFDIDASQFNFPDSGEFQGTIGVGAVLTAAPPITGTTGGTPSGTAFGGFTYAPTINNPVVEDLETTLAKDQQIMGSVAGILNGNFKL